jgi:DNA-binding Lrp family transcriptional regulator
MRYNRLKKAGIITGEVMHINPKIWGYEYTVDIRVETALNDEEEVVAKLRSKRQILGASSFGKSIMGFVALTKLENLRNVIEDIEANPKVKHIDTLIWAKTQNVFHPENLIIKPLSNFDQENKKTKNTDTKDVYIVYIDEIDKQIVKILAQQSRTSFNSIAKQLNISTHNVIQRYKKLREGNVLTLSTITVDLTKLGYAATHAIFLKLGVQSKMSEIRELLIRIPNALLLIEHTGAYDLRVDIAITNIEDIFQTMEQIRRINGIERIDNRILKPPQQFPKPLYNKLILSLGQPVE